MVELDLPQRTVGTSAELLVFPDSSVGKESACSAGDPSLIPGLGRSPGEGIGYPLQYSWAALVAQLVKNLPAVWETWVQSLGWEDLLEKEMATHSNTLAWKIPWTEEPGRLQSMGSQRVWHDWETSLSLSQLQRNFISWGQSPSGYLRLWCNINENLHH